MLNDSLLVFDRLQEGTGQRRVVAIGLSIGAAPAAYLARHRPVAGLILVTPFDSLEALAREHYFWAPVGLLLRHHMPTIEFLRETQVPTALIVAGRDAIVPARRSEPLRHVIPNWVFDRTIFEAGHNDLYDHPHFVSAIRESLEALAGSAGRQDPNGADRLHR